MLKMFALKSFTHQVSRFPKWTQIRSLSTLAGHPYIYVFPNEPQSGSHTLSLLPTEPTNPSTAIGVTSTLPPTTNSFRENPNFLKVLQDVISEHGHEDPDAISQAQVMVSTSGANLSGGSLSGASGQGGAGSAGRGGWIHISDNRRPPEFGRIAWPEDIFGSLEVDANGSFVGDNGNYQPSGTYRIVTRDGIFGLSPFLREKMVQKLRDQQ